MDKEYPEISNLRKYSDEIKLQIDNILCGKDSFRGVTEKLMSAQTAAEKDLNGIATNLAKYATDIVAPRRDDNGEPTTDPGRIDMLELRKLANGLKLAQVLKIHERNATYWLYRVDALGNPRKK